MGARQRAAATEPVPPCSRVAAGGRVNARIEIDGFAARHVIAGLVHELRTLQGTADRLAMENLRLESALTRVQVPTDGPSAAGIASQRLALNASAFALEAAASSLDQRAPNIAGRCRYEARRLRALVDELPHRKEAT